MTPHVIASGGIAPIGAQPHRASFRDPAGFIFTQDGILYRQINPAGRADYDALMASGLYARLIETGDLVRHEVRDTPSPEGLTPLVIQPERVDFISYPYEWCFS